MKSLILGLALLALVSAEELRCDIYTCSPMGKDICANSRSNTSNMVYNMQACDTGKLCDLKFQTGFNDTCAKTYSTARRFPGENCAADSECYSGKCVVDSKVCFGAAAGEACDDDSVCGLGLYCDSVSQKCVKARNLTESCTDGKCDASLVCNSGVCSLIGKLKVGDAATAPAACASFYVAGGKCAEGRKLVRDKGVDAESGPLKCSDKRTECQYKSGEALTTESCVCGKTVANQRYCNPGVGDLDIKDYISYVNSLKYGACHVSKGALCMPKTFETMGTAYYKAIVAHDNMTRWANFQDNPECVKKVLNSEYWNAIDSISKASDDDEDKFGLYLFLGVAIGAVVVIAILLLVIYMKKGKGDDEEGTTEGLKVTTSS